MFHALSGFKAQYQDLTILSVAEFDEWRVVVYAPGLILQGTRQYGQAKAKDHALLLAKSYLREVKGLEEVPELDWQPTGPQDWLVWKG
jgi:hypothetical protein